MQLLYCYIENHRNIKNQGFNFSSEYRFSYDKKTDILTVADNPNYIPNFSILSQEITPKKRTQTNAHSPNSPATSPPNSV
jgi:hypothetical protein